MMPQLASSSSNKANVFWFLYVVANTAHFFDICVMFPPLHVCNFLNGLVSFSLSLSWVYVSVSVKGLSEEIFDDDDDERRKRRTDLVKEGMTSTSYTTSAARRTSAWLSASMLVGDDDVSHTLSLR